MYILIAVIIACSVGIAAHYSLPRRDLRGVALTPAITTVATGVIYTGLQWAGLPETSLWLWLASIVGGIAIGVVSTILLTRARSTADATQAAELGISLTER